MVAPTRVAVCGGGISGCVLARRLAESGMSVVLIEQGRGVGGRISTRRNDSLSGVGFDHGAPSFHSTTVRFSSILDDWLKNRWVDEWRARVESVVDSGLVQNPSFATVGYVGIPSMSALPQSLIEHTNVHTVFRTKVTEACLDLSTQTWALTAGGSAVPGEFDVLVCTDYRSCPQILQRQQHTEIPTTLSLPHMKAAVAATGNSPRFVLMVAFEQNATADIPFDFATVDCSTIPELGFVVRNSSKPGRSLEYDSWVIHSSSTFAAEQTKRLRGQPRAQVLKSVQPTLMAAFQKLLHKFSQTPPEPIHSAAHRWGAAFPLSTRSGSGQPLFVADVDGRFVSVGDWLGGGNVEGAVLSADQGAGAVIRQFSQTASY